VNELFAQTLHLEHFIGPSLGVLNQYVGSVDINHSPELLLIVYLHLQLLVAPILPVAELVHRSARAHHLSLSGH
jgi:hypothetical protein